MVKGTTHTIHVGFVRQQPLHCSGFARLRCSMQWANVIPLRVDGVHVRTLVDSVHHRAQVSRLHGSEQLVGRGILEELVPRLSICEKERSAAVNRAQYDQHSHDWALSHSSLTLEGSNMFLHGLESGRTTVRRETAFYVTWQNMIANIVEMSTDPNFSPDFDSQEYWARWYGSDPQAMRTKGNFCVCIEMVSLDFYRRWLRRLRSSGAWVVFGSTTDSPRY